MFLGKGVLDRLMTHLSIHVWLRLEGGSLDAGLDSAVLLEGVGVMGVAGTVVGLEAGVEVVVILAGTFWCLLKVFRWLILSVFSACLFILLRYA